MILVDTSVWVDHLRVADTALARLLETDNVATHPFVIGELACGNLRRRDDVLTLLQDLPQAGVAADEEVLHFIERHRLMGAGIGYIDAHLLASAFLTADVRIWSHDRRLASIAQRLNVAFAN